MWIVYCEKKNEELKKKKERLTSFDEIILEIENKNFVTVENTSKNHPKQRCFLVEINDYPILAPFNERGNIIQLITFFPSRRMKNE